MEFVIIIVVVLLAISIHEYAHAKFADMAGDPTPRYYGRVTLNPLAHLDPVGTLFIIITSLTGFGIGWGKPVLVNPSKMHNPRWDHFVSVAAGPLSNLLQAAVFGVLFRLAGMPSIDQPLGLLLHVGVMINISLFLFNLIPLGPLDGHWLVGAFLPDPLRQKWYLFNRTTGSFLLLGLVLIGQISGNSPLFTILRPAVLHLQRLILG